MKQFLIYNKNSGLELGVYEGVDELDAYGHLMADAGYDDGVDEIPDCIFVGEVNENN